MRLNHMTNSIWWKKYLSMTYIRWPTMVRCHNMNALNKFKTVRSAWRGPPAPAPFAHNGWDTYPASLAPLALKFFWILHKRLSVLRRSVILQSQLVILKCQLVILQSQLVILHGTLVGHLKSVMLKTSDLK